MWVQVLPCAVVIFVSYWKPLFKHDILTLIIIIIIIIFWFFGKTNLPLHCLVCCPHAALTWAQIGGPISSLWAFHQIHPLGLQKRPRIITCSADPFIKVSQRAFPFPVYAGWRLLLSPSAGPCSLQGRSFNGMISMTRKRSPHCPSPRWFWWTFIHLHTSKSASSVPGSQLAPF